MTEQTLIAGDLATITEDIHAANEKAAESFQEWVMAVGGRLREAQQLLSIDKSHKSEFSKWAEREFGWSRGHAHRIIDAEKVIHSLMSPIGDMKALPTNEAQCRELSRLKDGDKQAVWQEVIESGEPITAALIREKAKPYLPEKNPAESQEQRAVSPRKLANVFELTNQFDMLFSEELSITELKERFITLRDAIYSLRKAY